MIYTRFGTPLTITGYCGAHQIKGYPAPLVLTKIRHEDDGSEGYYHPAFMKADGGIGEIDTAVDVAPVVELGAKELKAALKDAS